MKPDGVIEFPGEWFGDETWHHVEHVLTLEVKSTGALMFVSGGVLTDGTNLVGLCWPGGQNLARCGPATSWALEERVDPDGLPEARRVWRNIIEAQIEGMRLADEQFGRPTR